MSIFSVSIKIIHYSYRSEAMAEIPAVFFEFINSKKLNSLSFVRPLMMNLGNIWTMLFPIFLIYSTFLFLDDFQFRRILSGIGHTLQNSKHCVGRVEQCSSEKIGFGGLVPRQQRFPRIGVLFQLHRLPIEKTEDSVWTNEETGRGGEWRIGGGGRRRRCIIADCNPFALGELCAHAERDYVCHHASDLRHSGEQPSGGWHCCARSIAPVHAAPICRAHSICEESAD